MLYQLSYLGAAQRIVPPSDVGAYRGSRRTCPEPMRTRRTLGPPRAAACGKHWPAEPARQAFPCERPCGQMRCGVPAGRRLDAPASDRHAGVRSPVFDPPPSIARLRSSVIDPSFPPPPPRPAGARRPRLRGSCGRAGRQADRARRRGSRRCRRRSGGRRSPAARQRGRRRGSGRARGCGRCRGRSGRNRDRR